MTYLYRLSFGAGQSSLDCLGLDHQNRRWWPNFYSQIRTGFEGIPYTIYKMRSMRVDAERDGAQWVKSADSRITKIGAILRRTRLDELPQLWCVFTGSMSLIGPTRAT